ncbi:hypothetical protein DEU34_1444 [Microbacterium sp. AG1240]|uniref:hypothetical protein n=1 Tax=Microbacterium sp. AG1240 TaxID=2183992 RepID=UPI000F1AE601|nr:hypothetical protein [Microbacterium sp. AG1240]RKT36914.1 hypothetical protein DEU34_1444 [Microbacterium sp. AG1240]
MAENSEERPVAPWAWPGEWVREEKFWRDIGARVLAGVVTAAIVYVGALVLGYLHTPEVGAGVMIVLIGAGALLLGSSGAAVLLGMRTRSRSGAHAVGRVLIGTLLIVLAVALVIGGIVDLVRP